MRRERFPCHRLQREPLVSDPGMHHVRRARAVMHVGIANPLWQEKRFRHPRRMRNLQFYLPGKRSIGVNCSLPHVVKHVFLPLLIHSNCMGKSLQRECIFFQRDEIELTKQEEMYCFNRASAFYTSISIVKHIDEYQLQDTNSNRKSHRKFAYVPFHLWLQTFAVDIIRLEMGDSKRPGRIAVKKSMDGTSFQNWLYIVTEEAECLAEYNVQPASMPTAANSTLCQIYPNNMETANETVSIDEFYKCERP